MSNNLAKETVLYVVFGALAFCVSVGTYALFAEACGMNVLVANVLSWIITVMFAFATNRRWVFSGAHDADVAGDAAGGDKACGDKTRGGANSGRGGRDVRDERGALWRQMAKFYAGRLFTLGVEEVILLVFVTWLGWGSVAVKVAAQVIVIVLNYVISKWIVFR